MSAWFQLTILVAGSTNSDLMTGQGTQETAIVMVFTEVDLVLSYSRYFVTSEFTSIDLCYSADDHESSHGYQAFVSNEPSRLILS
jgi:hypothetical protein